MAEWTLKPTAGGGFRHRDQGVDVYTLLESPDTNIKINTTTDYVDALGAACVDVFCKLGTFTDGSYTVTLQGANVPGDSNDWRTIGSASSAMAASNAVAGAQGMLGASSLQLPRYIRVLFTAGGGPATGTKVTYIQLHVRY